MRVVSTTHDIEEEIRLRLQMKNWALIDSRINYFNENQCFVLEDYFFFRKAAYSLEVK